jgi:hypothetical protein
MKPSRVIVTAVLSSFLILSACGDSGGGGGATVTSRDPCEVLSDALLARHFTIPEGAEISREPSKYSPHPLCTVNIPKPNAEELQKQYDEAIGKWMQEKMQGKDVKRPSISPNHNITLTLLKPAESPAQAMAQFDSAMRMLQEGVTGGTEETQVTFQADVEPVDGIGDKAMWAQKLYQLSIVQGPQILHITVNSGEGREQDIAKAKAIAADILAGA